MLINVCYYESSYEYNGFGPEEFQVDIEIENLKDEIHNTLSHELSELELKQFKDEGYLYIEKRDGINLVYKLSLQKM
jgi:hypothetical protein